MATKTTLSSKTIETVKSTVPLLQSHGKTITTHFYKRMFSKHPELLNLFNQTHQKLGRQPSALANAVYAAAAHIDCLEEILPEVKLIAHKHRSLGVKPEHYPIVGENLLAAIKEVLGETASPEVLAAWAEAYQVIADVFIQMERQLYEEAEQQPGGWKDFKHFIVVKKVKESDVITSFYLRAKDGERLPAFKPGQYISIKAKIPGEEYTHIRQYSLSDRPGKDYFRISVKREDATDAKPAGVVSTYLHQQVGEGDVLEISAPAGVFTLDQNSDQPVVLISGGVGFTPLVSMLKTLAHTSDRPVTFIHAAINGRYHALRDEVLELASQHPNISTYFCYERPTDEDRALNRFDKEGYFDLQWLQSILKNKDAQYYFCGPVPFMREILRILNSMGIEEQNINYEFFGPKGEL
jgi:nitric oxide dioxygenase